MKQFALLFFFSLFLFKVQGQKTIEIPEFKNINQDDKYPSRSIPATFTANFDILISLKGYSAWGPDHSIKILAHHKSVWYKLEINTDDKPFDPYLVCIATCKINDSIGNIIWEGLKQNHLFDMHDDRTDNIKELYPPLIIDTIYYKKITEVVIRGTSGSDMPEYEFEILTPKDYKKLYFYSPHEKLGYCPKTNEIKWITNCINAFEKYLGK